MAENVARYDDTQNPDTITGYDRTDVYFNEDWQVVEERTAGDVDPPTGGDIVVGASDVYWINRGTGIEGPDGEVKKVAIAGGSSIPLATHQNNPAGLAMDATNIYWINRGSDANNYADGSVMKVGLNGGTPTTMASDQATPRGIAVDATDLFWCRYNDLGTEAQILKLPLTGGSSSVLSSRPGLCPQRLVADTTHLYWIDPGTFENAWTDASLMRIPLAGGAPTTLASAQCSPTDLAIGGNAAYWTNACAPNLPGGTVMSFAPK